MRTTSLILLLAAFCLTTMAQPASVPEGAVEPAVMLEPFVMTHFFDVDAKLVDGKVRSAKVTSLAPGLRKLGVRLGDHLTSIEGLAVAGMERAELESAMSTSPAPGEKKDFVFSRRHGFLARKLSTISVFIQNSADPATSPEPTALSAPSPAEEQSQP